MIDLNALKEQLKLLGHDLPDSQVVAILKEMNIDFNGDEAADDCVSDGRLAATSEKEEGRNHDKAERAPNGAARTGSILDSFHEKQHLSSGAVAEGVQSYFYGYTSAAHGAAALRPPGTGTYGAHSGRTAIQSPGNNMEGGRDDGDLEEPGISCRYCAASEHPDHRSLQGGTSAFRGLRTHVDKVQGTHPGLRSPQDPGRSSLSHQTGAHALMDLSLPPDDLSASLRGLSLRCPPADGAARSLDITARDNVTKAAYTELKAPSAAPRTTGAVRDQQPKAVGANHKAPAARSLDLEDGEESNDLSESDKDPLGLGASLQKIMFGSRLDLRGIRPVDMTARGRSALAGAEAQGPYGGWMGGRRQPLDAPFPADYLAQGPLSPQASDRSLASRASTRCSSASKARAKKVDRVQRYQQLQQEWNQNRFLKQGGGANRGTSRKPVNFHSHFASLHAAEEAERQRVLREARARTKKELGGAIEAPTANRRDELRWQTRMRLKNLT